MYQYEWWKDDIKMNLLQCDCRRCFVRSEMKRKFGILCDYVIKKKLIDNDLNILIPILKLRNVAKWMCIVIITENSIIILILRV